MHPILAAYGDGWFSFLGYLLRFFVIFAPIATVLGILLGWLIWGRRGDSAERLEEENDRLLREYHNLQADLEKADS